jgi:cytochrome c oxidase subunit I
LFFLLVGFFLVILIRWQQAFPAQPIPLVSGWLGHANAPGGVLLPEVYNQSGAMHGTIMVFLGVVPLAFGAFANKERRNHLHAPARPPPRT